MFTVLPQEFMPCGGRWPVRCYNKDKKWTWDKQLEDQHHNLKLKWNVDYKSLVLNVAGTPKAIFCYASTAKSQGDWMIPWQSVLNESGNARGQILCLEIVGETTMSVLEIAGV